jgi:hypothetical protein
MSSSTTARLTAPDIMARKGGEKIVYAMPFKSQDRP